MDSLYSVSLRANIQCVHDGRAPWLVTVYFPNLFPRHDGGFIRSVCVQTRAVMDDFGTLVAVERFS